MPKNGNFVVHCSTKVDRLVCKVYHRLAMIEEGEAPGNWKKALSQVKKAVDKKIDVHDFIGFMPPNLLKRKTPPADVVFSCPDGEDIFLFYDKPEAVEKKLTQLAGSLGN